MKTKQTWTGGGFKLTFELCTRRLACVLGKTAWCAGLVGFLFGATVGVADEVSGLTEYQIKALFLFNFAKYAYWPAEAFPQAETPITIGVLGENHFGDDLAKVVEGKLVSGRKIVVLPVDNESDWGKCQILFISGSEKKRMTDILAKVKGQAVLTVGETEQFNEQGGMIQFTKREGKVRLEVNLDAAREARVQISAKLLSVADRVKGKP